MRTRTLTALPIAALAAIAHADGWQVAMTVDNQFALYVGNAAQTTGALGSGTIWWATYTFSSDDAPGTDYVYIVTSSDRSQAQGFIGSFTDTTTHRTFHTGDHEWEVFPAGAYAATNPYLPQEWPTNLMPTREKVDAAVAFATANQLWVPAVTVEGYTNGVSPWGARTGIAPEASWIWHDSRRNGGPPSPLIGSFNHDEFLIFRAASPVSGCYANCDSSTSTPLLNISDFICFQARFAAGDPRANCDNSTTPPILNVGDFICFQTAFAAGCR